MSTDRQDHSRLGVAIAGLRAGFAQIGRVDIEDLTLLARVARSVIEGFVAAGILTVDHPRSWVLPTIPEDVKAVRDGDGMIWYRHSDGDEPQWWNEDDDAKTTAELLAAREVTELLPGEFETPEVIAEGGDTNG